MKISFITLFAVGFCLVALRVTAKDDFEGPPVSYYEAASEDPVARLQTKMKTGELKLEADEKGSYLPSLLDALCVPASSQCLVFSKTSLQLPYIHPRKPRAIYFNDDVYIGYVQDSSIMELVGVDPQLGCVFYTFEIPNHENEKTQTEPVIIRDRGQCLSCHATTRTAHVPGVLVRSIYPDREGRARSGSSSYVTDHRSPFIQRWGGWYVTGNHGSMRHLGNTFAVDAFDPQLVDLEKGANLTQLPGSIDAEAYPNSGSDIVALMVLEHQTRLHNLITRANYEARQAKYLDTAMNEALDRDFSHVSDSTQRRIASVGKELVNGLLFVEEFPLSDPVSGSEVFQIDFSSRAVCDSKGRSFREFDLKSRLFKYRCSYLILSSHFDGLPKPVMDYVRDELNAILSGEKAVAKGVELSDGERKSIQEMLEELKPGWLAS
jgi:hypothetical protein